MDNMSLVPVTYLFVFVSSLHRVLMDLQNQQLSQLSEWLAKTEERTKKINSEPLGPDLENLKRQVEEHKVSSCYIFLESILFHGPDK